MVPVVQEAIGHSNHEIMGLMPSIHLPSRCRHRNLGGDPMLIISKPSTCSVKVGLSSNVVDNMRGKTINQGNKVLPVIGRYCYNFFKPWLEKESMPTFIDQCWFGHKIQARPGDVRRQLVRWVFRHDILPYLYGRPLILNLIIIPAPTLTSDETLIYGWVLESFDSSQVFKPETGSVNISPNKREKVRPVTDCVMMPKQYTLKMKMSKGTISKTGDIAILKVQDRDDFYRSTIIPILLALLLVLIGFVLGKFT